MAGFALKMAALPTEVTATQQAAFAIRSSCEAAVTGRCSSRDVSDLTGYGFEKAG